ncbi:MAG: AAA family ATPase [Lachnospiraceae bacterium]|nr:AAA family ATPase [Lachnospiraceae bacterium]
MSGKALPIGIDDFEKLITNQYYYIDKSLLIKELLDKKGEANLFTRPRRFGKTLNLSMLRYYFETPVDGKSRKYLFDGLKIMDTGEKYTSLQGKYPVITLTLKSAKQPEWEMAYDSLVDDIAREFKRHEKLLESDKLSEEDKEKFTLIKTRKAALIDYAKALQFLSECLYQYYEQKVIILIDEYDVPLENAFYEGFYDRMIKFIRSLFESALKTNPFLEFSVITGCLRISRESIFTGLNNLEINSILTINYDEFFGFVQKEVEEILKSYGLENKMEIMKDWYDGYQFGGTKVYNPWSVVNYVKALVSDENAFPTATWSNTSSNSIVRDLIERASAEVQGDVESLVNGGVIEKKVHEEITYEDIYKTEDNLWNFLFFTGYLKLVRMRMEGVNRFITMAIPNKELLYIYENTIERWFQDKIKVEDLRGLYEAMFVGDAQGFEIGLKKQLQKTISYMDNKEAFYHGFLLGLMANLKEYRIKSNRESGYGRYDICIYSLDVAIPPVVIELKLAKRYKELDTACEDALAQIKEKKYGLELVEEGYEEMICYGIGFFKKQVKVHVRRENLEEDLAGSLDK